MHMSTTNVESKKADGGTFKNKEKKKVGLVEYIFYGTITAVLLCAVCSARHKSLLLRSLIVRDYCRNSCFCEK